MSGGGTGAGAKSSGEGRDADPIAVLAQLGAGDDPYTVVHQHGGRTRLRSLNQAKGKQRYRLAGGEVVARPTARLAIAGDRNGAALISCFAGRVEIRAKHQQLTLEPHQAAILAANGDVQQFASLAAARLGGEHSMDVHELVEAATRALVEAPTSTSTAPAEVDREGREEKTAALVGAAAASAPEIVLPDASLAATDDLDEVDTDEAEAEDFPEERRGTGRWILAALGVAAVIALVLLAVLPAGDGDDDDDAVAGPATTLERSTTTDDPAAATTAPETTATTAAETTTTEAPTTTTIAPPTASLQPKSCVQQGTTITYAAGLTNTSQVRASYDIRVAFIDQTGSEVGSATATVEDVAAGASKDWSATGSVPSDLRDTGASCAVTSITGRPA